jgi:fumarate hydratase subunit beta
MTTCHELTLPTDRALIRDLRVGDLVTLNGEIMIGGGLPTHERVLDNLRLGLPVPDAVKLGSLFHLGVQTTPSVGGGPDDMRFMNPTTSTRFNHLMPDMIQALGLMVVGGKGGLDAASVAAMKEVGCVYLSFIGGACPLLSEAVEEVVSEDWPELTSHYRMRVLRVHALGPATVGIDAHGNSIYENLTEQALSRKAGILRALDDARAASGDAMSR